VRPPCRAGFARQGAKEKQLLKEGNAFNVSSFVLRAMMSGQYWPEGDEVYHAELTVPVLLVHGMHDKFVPVEEDQRMAEVEAGTRVSSKALGCSPLGVACAGGRGLWPGFASRLMWLFVGCGLVLTPDPREVGASDSESKVETRKQGAPGTITPPPHLMQDSHVENCRRDQ
jgi:hypothetical protein